MPINTYTRITWDDSANRWIEAGVDHCVLFVKDDTTTSPPHAGYKKGVAWDGITAISENPTGAEPNDVYADNIKYASLRSAESFEGSIEALTYPDEFIPCDGMASLGTGSNTGIYAGQQTRKTFAIAYRTRIGNGDLSDDTKYKLHIIYGLTASPTEKSHETINDSPDADTFSWDVSSVPVPYSSGTKFTSTIEIDSRKVTSGTLKAIEDALYGVTTTTGESPVAGSESYLPTPDEIIGMIVSA